VAENDAYDFVLRRPDGTQTGNYTGEVLLRREREGSDRRRVTRNGDARETAR
jgi:hypothetical protein